LGEVGRKKKGSWNKLQYKKKACRNATNATPKKGKGRDKAEKGFDYSSFFKTS
jgi:hypothetical protein